MTPVKRAGLRGESFWGTGSVDEGRRMNNRVVVDPGIQHGKPIIRGTRVPVARLLSELAGGMTFEDICREYDVTVEDLRAAVQYAEELVEEQTHYPLPAG
jgi:uncharacterized protein (DUF433 family)